MKDKKLRWLQNIVYPLVALGIILALWAIFAAAVNKELIVPSVKSTFEKLFEIMGSGKFYAAVGNTVLRTLIAFVISVVAAIILSVLSLYKPVRLILSPIIKILRATPTIGIILLTVVWLKPTTSPILISFLIVFPILYSGFFSSISDIDKELTEMSSVYKVSSIDKLRYLYLPNIAPQAFDVMQSTLSLTVKVVISAEVLAQTRNSMGIMMQMARGYLETAELLAWTLVAIILGYLMETLVFLIKKLVVRWK